MARQATWIAGPVQYDAVERKGLVVSLRWDFIGGASDGKLRRWRLVFDAATREMNARLMRVSTWDNAHAKELSLFYRPSAVRRGDLPPGTITDALRAMLSEREVAAATRAGLNQKWKAPLT